MSGGSEGWSERLVSLSTMTFNGEDSRENGDSGLLLLLLLLLADIR